MALAGCYGTANYHSAYPYYYDSSFRAQNVSDGENGNIYDI